MRKTTTPVTTLANKSTTVGMMPARSDASTAGEICNVLFRHIPTVVWNVYYMWSILHRVAAVTDVTCTNEQG